jgi:tRNA A-37 threonylcarbamoyl transferase component Bud32
MIHLSEADYQSLREGAEVLEKDGYGDKVLRLRDGNILKLFRLKHFISSARLLPYAKRFAKNAPKLQALGIRTINPLQLYRLPDRKLDAVLYEPIAGKTIKELCRDTPDKVSRQFVESLGAYIGFLHESGVFFRSLHLGNIIIDEQDNMGIIDIADMRILRSPLSKSMRLRNFSHLIRMKDFSDPIKNQSDALVEAYINSFPRSTAVFKAELLQRLSQW